MKKITFLVTQSGLGGAQKYISEIAPFLANEKWQVLIVAGEGNGDLFRKIPEARCQRLKHLKRTPYLWETILAIKEILNLLKKEKPDVLFLCSTAAGVVGSIASFLIKLTTKSYKLKTIYRIGGWAFNDPRPWRQRKIIILIEKLTSHFKDKIIVNSEFDFQSALKYKIANPKKLIKIYNGIDTKKLNFLTRKQAREVLLKHQSFDNKHQIIIGTIANFYKTKGLRYLIEAMRILSLNSKNQALNISCLTIGDGLERKKLENLIKKYHLQAQLSLLGKISNAYQYLKAFDIFILPSLKEGFPWVILEAIAAEIPIIATNVGVMPEIIENGNTGFLIEPGNSNELAEKIQKLLKSPELKKQFIKKAYGKLEYFSKKEMLKKTKEIIEN